MTIEGGEERPVKEDRPAKDEQTASEGRPVRLASIVAIDVVGFSTMSEKDQVATAGKIANLRKRIEGAVAANGGRIFNTAGDGFMLEFTSAGAAVAAINALLDRKPKGEPAIRVGAHVGDVVVAINNDLLGHGVNVAARLQSLAAPNSALVSGEFRSMARTSPSAAFKSKGRQPLENINQRVATFAIIPKRQRIMRSISRGFWATAGVAVIAAGAFFAPRIIDFAKERGLISASFLAASADPAPAPAAGTQLAASVPVENSVAALPPAPPPEASPAASPEGAEILATPATPSPAPEPPPEIKSFQPGQELRDCATCPELVVLPAGSFQMGSAATEPGRFDTEGPQHEVAMPMVAMGKYEVTFAEWDACLAGGGCNGFSPQDHAWGRGRRPVIGVSWTDAQSYIDWLNKTAGKKLYRLPTEAEWEYAARGGTATPYSFGKTIKRAQAVFGADKSDPVGSYIANAFGLFDMAGNAAEWTADCYRNTYKGAPADGAAVEDANCRQRAYRGGDYADPASVLRVANRRRAEPALRDSGIGFRVVRILN